MVLPQPQSSEVTRIQRRPKKRRAHAPFNKCGLSRPYFQLSHSTSAVRAVFTAVVEKRMRAGDDYIAKVQESSSSEGRTSICEAPQPRSNMEMSKEKFDNRIRAAGQAPSTSSAFHGEVHRDMTIEKYSTRLFEFSRENQISNAVFIIALVMLDRAAAHTPELFMRSQNAHRLVLSSFVLAAKMHEDSVFVMQEYARVGMLAVSELNAMEVAFFEAIGFRGHVTRDAFFENELELIEEALTNQSRRREVLQVLRLVRVYGVDEVLRRSRVSRSNDSQNHASRVTNTSSSRGVKGGRVHRSRQNASRKRFCAKMSISNLLYGESRRPKLVDKQLPRARSHGPMIPMAIGLTKEGRCKRQVHPTGTLCKT